MHTIPLFRITYSVPRFKGSPVYSTSPALTGLPRLPSSVLDSSPLEVFQALVSLDPSKAMGPDAIGPKVLKFCSHALFIPIHHLFNTSLSTSSLPMEWRLHRVTPVFKSGDKLSVKNYRPICTVSKVLESLYTIRSLTL